MHHNSNSNSPDQRVRTARERYLAACSDDGKRWPGPDLTATSCDGQWLADAGRCVAEELTEQLGDAAVVALAGSDGKILWIGGSPAMVEKSEQCGLVVGSDWSERVRGANAIGTCLCDDAAIALFGAEHSLAALRDLSGAGAPIHACVTGQPAGVTGNGNRLIGALALYGQIGESKGFALTLATVYAEIIECCLFSRASEAGVRLAIHRNSAMVGTPGSGLAVFSEHGHFVWGNAMALRLLPLTPGGSFATEIVTPWVQFIAASGSAREPVELVLRDGSRLHAKVVASAGECSTESVQGCRHDLKHLGNDDARIAEAVHKALRIVERDIPLLVQGETGTGKEWFAQAFHNSGSRRAGPFVAVNCAAIPATLIEAELFGYAEGAFTGARRYGARGKIREADGGTLFLDEIGDMPIDLQAVLLRVLETRRVTPLGSDRDEAVNIRLVCASHQSLRDLVDKGGFRADLFFRLSGMTIALPPLRERTDFELVVRRILAEESALRPVVVEPEAFALLRSYAWPGNLRQLRNVLRLCVALLGHDGVLLASSLPTEIRSAEPVANLNGLRNVQARLARESVDRHGGNISAAARELGITRTTLYRLLGPNKKPPAGREVHS